MGVLEVISEFDPFLKAHIEKYGNAGKGTPSYLSSTTRLEFIELMGEQVLAKITNQITVIVNRECSCTYCKSLWIRASVK